MTATFVTSRPSDPTAQEPGLRIASLGKRLLAALVDSCLLTAIWGVGLAIWWVVAGADADFWSDALAVTSEDPSTAELLTYAGQWLLLIVVWIVYAGVMTSRPGSWNGQTLGKRAAQVRIVTTDGQPLPARTAWWRVVLTSAVLGASDVLGPLLDVALGGGTDAADIGSYVVLAVLVVAMLFTLRGGLRQTAFDVAVGTIVVMVPSTATVTAPADPDAPPVTFTQAPVDLPAAIIPRPVTAKTWIGVILSSLLLVLLVGAGSVDLPEDRSQAILALPETKEALVRVADDEDAVVIYAFTSVDRLWVSTLDRGEDPDHVCLKATSDDLCDGVFEW